MRPKPLRDDVRMCGRDESGTPRVVSVHSGPVGGWLVVQVRIMRWNDHPLVLLLAWSLTWDVLIWFIKTYYEQLILFIAPILANIVVKKVVTTRIGPKTVIKRRFAWMFYDLYELLLSCVTGITKALVRFALVMVVTLFSLPRMDVSIFPAWLSLHFNSDGLPQAPNRLAPVRAPPVADHALLVLKCFTKRIAHF